VFAARLGYKRYLVRAHAPLEVRRDAGDAQLDDAAARLGALMSAFLEAHPTQWFDFRE
jgi:hypothetical protein